MRDLIVQYSGPVSVILPISILALKLAFKACVDQNVSAIGVLRAIFSIPVDISFLAISLYAAFFISPVVKVENIDIGRLVVLFFVLILWTIPVVILCRRSDALFDKTRIGLSMLLCAVSYMCSIPPLIFSISLLTGA
jgi:hypothetical protein